MQRRRASSAASSPPSSITRRQSHITVFGEPNHLFGAHHQRWGIRWSIKKLLAIIFVTISVIMFFQRLSSSVKESNFAVFEQCRESATNIIVDGRPVNNGTFLSNKLFAPCTYFRPSHYFFHPSQPGYQYKQLIQNIIDDNIKLSMWSKQVSQSHVFPSRPAEFLLQRGIGSVGAIMMPKVGSRTVESLFLERLSDGASNSSNKSLPGLSSKFIHRSTTPRVGVATPRFWKEMAKRQKQGNSSTDILFALVRNPITRFLSSLAQTLSVPMQRKCEACFLVLQPCVHTSNESYSELVKCVIDRMQQQHEQGYYYYDVHMAPQAIFLAGALHGNDVKIAVFSMDHGDSMNALLHAFDDDVADTQHNKRKKNARDEKEYSEFVQGRFGKALLNPDKARAALDQDMIHNICQLYAIDVQMLMHLGFPVDECT